MDLEVRAPVSTWICEVLLQIIPYPRNHQKREVARPHLIASVSKLKEIYLLQSKDTEEGLTCLRVFRSQTCRSRNYPAFREFEPDKRDTGFPRSMVLNHDAH